MSTTIHASVDPQGARVEARTEDGHPVVMDADPPHGGGTAASPVETLLAALAGCTAADVTSILRKKRQHAATYDIEVVGDRATEHPKVVTRIRVEHRVTGNVEPEALRRSIELSATKYCPISAMLARVAEVEHRYRLTAADGTVTQDVVAVLGPGREVASP